MSSTDTLIFCGFKILFPSVVPGVFEKSFTVVFGIYHADFLFGMHGLY